MDTLASSFLTEKIMDACWILLLSSPANSWSSNLPWKEDRLMVCNNAIGNNSGMLHNNCLHSIQSPYPYSTCRNFSTSLGSSMELSEIQERSQKWEDPSLAEDEWADLHEVSLGWQWQGGIKVWATSHHTRFTALTTEDRHDYLQTK